MAYNVPIVHDVLPTLKRALRDAAKAGTGKSQTTPVTRLSNRLRLPTLA